VSADLRFVTIILLVIVGYLVVNVFCLTYFVRAFAAQKSVGCPIG
jgi:hypothetical protein